MLRLGQYLNDMTTTIADPLTASLVEAFDNIQNNNWTIEDYFKFQNRIVSTAELNGYKKGKKNGAKKRKRGRGMAKKSDFPVGIDV